MTHTTVPLPYMLARTSQAVPQGSGPLESKAIIQHDIWSHYDVCSASKPQLWQAQASISPAQGSEVVFMLYAQPGSLPLVKADSFGHAGISLLGCRCYACWLLPTLKRAPSLSWL